MTKVMSATASKCAFVLLSVTDLAAVFFVASDSIAEAIKDSMCLSRNVFSVLHYCIHKTTRSLSMNVLSVLLKTFRLSGRLVLDVSSEGFWIIQALGITVLFSVKWDLFTLHSCNHRGNGTALDDDAVQK